MKACKCKLAQRGVTLIELLIIVTVVGILLALAVPGYSNYILRVNRAEAIRLLLQAAMCQERVHASRGNYDTGLCDMNDSPKHYQVSYQQADTKGPAFVVIATPVGAQQAEPCGSLLLNQDGLKRISATNISATKCWNGR